MPAKRRHRTDRHVARLLCAQRAESESAALRRSGSVAVRRMSALPEALPSHYDGRPELGRESRLFHGADADEQSV